MLSFIIIVLSCLFFLSEQLTFYNPLRYLQSIDVASYDLKMTSQSGSEITFQQFKKNQAKRYQSSEEQFYRLLIFKQNSQLIKNHNSGGLNPQPNSRQPVTPSYTLQFNKFTDLTQLQFRQIYTSTYQSTQAVQKKAQLIVQKYQNFGCDCAPKSNSTGKASTTGRAGLASVNGFAGFQAVAPVFGDFNQDQLDTEIDSIIKATHNRRKNSQTQFDPIIQKYNPFFPTVPPLKNSSISSQTQYQSQSQFQSQSQSQSQSQTFQTSQISVSSSSKSLTRSLRLLQTTSTTNTSLTNIEIDWTRYSGQIRYQGNCGSCYIFSTVDALSATNAIYKFGFFVQLSVQQVLDCGRNSLSYGCSGGFLQGSYAYLQYTGITTQTNYPYIAKQSSCKRQTGAFKISSFKTLESGSCASLITELKKKPIAVGIAGYKLRYYKEGVFNDCNDQIDHAVLLVGYKSGVGWKIKNSWGTDWGMKGYGWIQEGNTCGICLNAVTASIPQQSKR